MKSKLNRTANQCTLAPQKSLRKLTFFDLGDSSNKDGNFGISFNLFDVCEWKIVVSQGPSETFVLVLPILTNVVCSVVDLLKAMSQIQHISNKLKFLDYATLKIEIVNFIPMKLDGDMLFELPLYLQANGSFQTNVRHE